MDRRSITQGLMIIENLYKFGGAMPTRTRVRPCTDKQIYVIFGMISRQVVIDGPPKTTLDRSMRYLLVGRNSKK